MKFYDEVIHFSSDGIAKCVDFVEREHGKWATRDDAEQLEKERDAYRDECITRGGRELQALCEKEQAAKDAVEMAELVKKYAYYTDQAWVDAQAIIERYEGEQG